MSTTALTQPVNLQFDILASTLSKGAKLLLMALSTFDRDQVPPSKVTHKTLGQMLNVSAGSVGRYLKELKACNWVVKVTNCYRVNKNPEERKSPPPPQPKENKRQLGFNFEKTPSKPVALEGIISHPPLDPAYFCSAATHLMREEWARQGAKPEILCTYPFHSLYPKDSPVRDDSERVRFFHVLPQANLPYGLPCYEENLEINQIARYAIGFVFRRGLYPKVFMKKCIEALIEKYGEALAYKKMWDILWIFNYSVFGIDADPTTFAPMEHSQTERLDPERLSQLRARVAAEDAEKRRKLRKESSYSSCS